MTDKKIGVLVGCERSWPPAFISEINRRRLGMKAELVRLNGTHMGELCEYRAIVDRVSHEIPYYRTFLKVAVLSGTSVVNNPFRCSANDRFFNANLVTHMGFPHPRTVALPSYSHNEGINDDALRNLAYPIPWEEHINYLGGFPIVLRPVQDSMMKRLYILESYEDLLRSYQKTGAEPMLLREHISWDKYVRCICIGHEHMLPVKYSPGASWSTRYHQDTTYLSTEEKNRVLDSAFRINQALGYDVNAIDFAFKDGELYTVDVTNPVADFEVSTLTPYFFDWVVKTMADYVIGLAQKEQTQVCDCCWEEFFPRHLMACPIGSTQGRLPMASSYTQEENKRT